MKLLFDECIPRRFKESFPHHDCRTTSEVGWTGKKNGELLALAEQAGFEVLLTIDRGMEYQQNLKRRNIAIILIRTKSSRLADLLPLIPEILNCFSSIKAGDLTKVG
jgi:predicted nuclease of predicted toxin-antitoxin system